MSEFKFWCATLGLGIVIAVCIVFIWDENAEYEKMKMIPYQQTPVSTVLCHNKHGTLVYKNDIVERGREHVLTRLPCGMAAYGFGCCISDPPKDGTEDTRKWGIGTNDSDNVVSIDGRGVECVLIKGIL